MRCSNELEDEVSLGEHVAPHKLGHALGEPDRGEKFLADAIVVFDPEVDALDDHLAEAAVHPHQVADVVEEGTFDDALNNGSCIRLVRKNRYRTDRVTDKKQLSVSVASTTNHNIDYN